MQYTGDHSITIGEVLSSEPGNVAGPSEDGTNWRIFGDVRGSDAPGWPGSTEGNTWDVSDNGVNDPADQDQTTPGAVLTWNESCVSGLNDINVTINQNSPRLAIMPVVDQLTGDGSNYNGTVISFAWFFFDSYQENGPGQGDDSIRFRYLGPVDLSKKYKLDIKIEGNAQINNNKGSYFLDKFEDLNITGDLNITQQSDINIPGNNSFQDPLADPPCAPCLTQDELLDKTTNGSLNQNAPSISFPPIPVVSDNNPCVPSIQDPNYNEPIIEWTGNVVINTATTLNGTIHITGDLTIAEGAQIEGIVTFVVDGNIYFDHNRTLPYMDKDFSTLS